MSSGLHHRPPHKHLLQPLKTHKDLRFYYTIRSNAPLYCSCLQHTMIACYSEKIPSRIYPENRGEQNDHLKK